MIIFFEDGRLGNQFFQFFGLKKLYRNEKIILIGFKTLFSVIVNDEQILKLPEILDKTKFKSFFKSVLHLMASIRLITESKEDKNNSNIIITKKGLLSRINFFSYGFFQNSKYYDLNNDILFKTEIRLKAEIFFHNLNIRNKKTIFIHIRRGDYLIWPNIDTPAVLGLNWYLNEINIIKEKISNSFFIIFTDDIHYAEDFFGDDENIFISKNNEVDDFLLMSMCDHGILSASSFAFWAATLINKKSPTANLIAPKYWAGHRINKWFPENFIFDWLIYK
jgi:hypothetical protein